MDVNISMEEAPISFVEQRNAGSGPPTMQPQFPNKPTSKTSIGSEAGHHGGTDHQPVKTSARSGSRGLKPKEWRLYLQQDRFVTFQRFMVALSHKGLESIVLSAQREALPDGVHQSQLFLRAFAPDMSVVALALFAVDALQLGEAFHDDPEILNVWLDAAAVKAVFKYLLDTKTGSIHALTMKGFLDAADEIYLLTDVASTLAMEAGMSTNGGGAGGSARSFDLPFSSVTRGRQKQCIRVQDRDAAMEQRLEALDDGVFEYLTLEIPAARLQTQVRGLKTLDYKHVTLNVASTPLPARGKDGVVILQLEYVASRDANRSVNVDKYPLKVAVTPEGRVEVLELLTSPMDEVIAVLQAAAPPGTTTLTLTLLWSITLAVPLLERVVKSFGSIDRLQLQCCSRGRVEDAEENIVVAPDSADVLASGICMNLTASEDKVYLLRKRVQGVRE